MAECQCGCGGQPRTAQALWMPGHHVRVNGTPTERPEIAAKVSAKSKINTIGVGNPFWRGGDSSYGAAHYHLRKTKTGQCEKCSRSGKTDMALIHGRGGNRGYSSGRDDYRELCRSCHLAYDRGWDRL